MASSLASAASLVPAGAVLRARSRAPRRASRAAPVRASGATYDEVFDGATGQMIQTLSQSTETVSAGGLEWSYRLGVPEEGVEAKPHKVVLVHGAGMLAFTFSKLMRELQTRGYVCVAPDMPGHGGTSKPPPSSFAYDLSSYQNALGAFLDALEPVAEVHVSPADLEALQISAGQQVQVETRRGRIELAARVDPKLPKGMIFVPFCFTEAPANQLTNPALDPFGKIPELKFSAARLSAVS